MRVIAASVGIALLGLGCGGECRRVHTSAEAAHASLDEGFALLRTMPPAAAEASLRGALDDAIDEVARMPEDGYYRRRAQIYEHVLVEMADRLDDVKAAIERRDDAEEQRRRARSARRETAASLREACQGETLRVVEAVLDAHRSPADEREALAALEGVPAAPLKAHLASLTALEAVEAALPMHDAAIEQARRDLAALAPREQEAYESVLEACPR